MADDGDLVTELFGHFQHMGGEEHGLAFGGVLLHHLLQVEAGLRIEAGHRLIEDPDLRFVDERAHEHDLLPHAVGIREDLVIEGVAHLEGIGQRCDALFAQAALHFVDVAHEVQVFDALEPQEHVRAVRDEAEALLGFQRLAADALAVDEDVAFIGFEDAAHHLDGGRLAGAVGADEAHDLPGGNVQVDMVHGSLAAECLGDVFDFNHDFPPYFR